MTLPTCCATKWAFRLKLTPMAAAISAFNIAGEIAERNCRGPGTFKPALLDALWSLDAATLDSGVECERL